jgi:hypothetical protein
MYWILAMLQLGQLPHRAAGLFVAVRLCELVEMLEEIHLAVLAAVDRAGHTVRQSIQLQLPENSVHLGVTRLHPSKLRSKDGRFGVAGQVFAQALDERGLGLGCGQ